MKRNPNIIIAKIDFTANDVDLVGATITGFPTVLLFKSGAKNAPIVYTGKRDLASFVAFVESHQQMQHATVSAPQEMDLGSVRHSEL